MNTQTFPDRVAGGIYGLLIGDALGVPYEFHSPESVPPLDLIEMTPPIGFSRAHAGTPPGTWSDDGAQALALLDSLLSCNELDPDDLGQRLLSWLDDARYTPDNRVFDCGIQTHNALSALRRGLPAARAGGVDERSNGNGSLMRVLPLALWHSVQNTPDDALIADAHIQSRVTHGHPRSQVCCALYCVWARRIVANHPNPWPDALATVHNHYADDPIRRAELNDHFPTTSPAPAGRGTGYVVDCLHSAVQVQSAPDYESVVKAAVALGHDTDTTACVAGGIAGLRFGLSAIPQRWREALHGREFVDTLLTRLLASA